jgi:hypothetical protein
MDNVVEIVEVQVEGKVQEQVVELPNEVLGIVGGGVTNVLL